jgi:mannitol-1-phosphate 5-dehydrogenase
MGSFDIAVIGAGKTGRGFIGRLLQESGQTFLLVDKNKDLVEDLKASDGFEVEFFGGVRETFKVKNYVVEHTGSLSLHELFSHVKVVFVSVGGNNIVMQAIGLQRLLKEG